MAVYHEWDTKTSPTKRFTAEEYEGFKMTVICVHRFRIEDTPFSCLPKAPTQHFVSARRRHTQPQCFVDGIIDDCCAGIRSVASREASRSLALS
jgi:hypothetical protein